MSQYETQDHVHIGVVDIEQQYQQHIADLNRFSPTSRQASLKLGSMLLNPESWDRCIAEGILEDTNHELRALIAIARGDPRPMGEVYDEIRRQINDEINGTDLNKARGVANRHDPNGYRSPYFC